MSSTAERRRVATGNRGEQRRAAGGMSAVATRASAQAQCWWRIAAYRREEGVSGRRPILFCCVSSLSMNSSLHLRYFVTWDGCGVSFRPSGRGLLITSGLVVYVVVAKRRCSGALSQIAYTREQHVGGRTAKLPASAMLNGDGASPAMPCWVMAGCLPVTLLLLRVPLL